MIKAMLLLAWGCVITITVNIQAQVENYLQGTYYLGNPGTAPGGTDPDFLSLKEACDTLNSVPIIDDVKILVTSNLTETEGVTVKPFNFLDPPVEVYFIGSMGGVKPAITFLKGGWVWDGIWDMYIEGLIIESSPQSPKNTIPLTMIYTYRCFVTDCGIYYKSQSSCVDTVDNYHPNALLVQNALEFTYVTNTHISSNFPGVSPNSQGCTFKGGTMETHFLNNKVEGKKRGLVLDSLRLFLDVEFSSNEIIVNPDIAPVPVSGIYVTYVEADGFRINGNNIKLSSGNQSLNLGGAGIELLSSNSYGIEIIDNVISEFSKPVDDIHSNQGLFGIKIFNNDGSYIIQVRSNNIIMNDLDNDSVNNFVYAGIYLQDFLPITPERVRDLQLRKNTIELNEDDFSSFCVYVKNYDAQDSASLTLDSNTYNLGTPAAKIGFWNEIIAPTLPDWQAVSGQDLNSSSTISNSVVSDVESRTNLNIEFSLNQNFPNPFNPLTNLEFSIPEPGFVELKVYDLIGNEIAILVNEEKPAGQYKLQFDGGNLASGIYYYRLRTASFVQVRKMLLMK